VVALQQQEGVGVNKAALKPHSGAACCAADGGLLGKSVQRSSVKLPGVKLASSVRSIAKGEVQQGKGSCHGACRPT
jgi:hypothetical protein